MALRYLQSLFFFVFSLLAAFTSVSCGTTIKEPDPKVYYRRDIEIDYADKTYRGTAVLPRLNSYKLGFKSSGEMNLWILSSCHREVQKENVGYEHNYTYNPIAGLEDTAQCPLQIGGFDKHYGKHSFGYISFENPELTLKASLTCNGESWQANGVAICQAREGLLQRIAFDRPVKVVSSEKCDWHIQKSSDFMFPVKNRECQYLFESDDKQRFLLDTIGYEEIFLRKD